MNQETPEELLKRYKNFDECVILDVQFSHYQTNLTITFNYIFDEHGDLRKDLHTRKHVHLVFRLVQEVRFQNVLNDANVSRPEEMTWGLNEVSWVSVEDDPLLLAQYAGLPRSFRHVKMKWSSRERRIDVVFAEMEIHEE